MVADIAYLQQSQQEINQLEALFARQRAAYLAQPMPDATQRVQWLKALRELLFKEQQALIEAIDRDFSARSADETLLAEIMPSLPRHPLRRQAREEMDEARAPRGRPAIPAGLGPGGVPAAGRGRGDRALELSAVPLHRPADRGPRRRQPGDDQDERVDPGHRAPAQGPAGADLPPRTRSPWC
ncbi:aldehyde dehydrogenase [Pseudomonas aeruginosa]|nr:aldehyde dehydrogenase [Pseudomonas aeruginosa]